MGIRFYDYNKAWLLYGTRVLFLRSDERKEEFNITYNKYGVGEVLYSTNSGHKEGDVCRCSWEDRIYDKPCFVDITPEEGEEFEHAFRKLRVKEIRTHKIIYSSLETGLEYHSLVPDFLMLGATKKIKTLLEDREISEVFGWEK